MQKASEKQILKKFLKEAYRLHSTSINFMILSGYDSCQALEFFEVGDLIELEEKFGECKVLSDESVALNKQRVEDNVEEQEPEDCDHVFAFSKVSCRALKRDLKGKIDQMHDNTFLSKAAKFHKKFREEEKVELNRKNGFEKLVAGKVADEGPPPRKRRRASQGSKRVAPVVVLDGNQSDDSADKDGEDITEIETVIEEGMESVETGPTFEKVYREWYGTPGWWSNKATAPMHKKVMQWFFEQREDLEKAAQDLEVITQQRIGTEGEATACERESEVVQQAMSTFKLLKEKDMHNQKLSCTCARRKLLKGPAYHLKVSRGKLFLRHSYKRRLEYTDTHLRPCGKKNFIWDMDKQKVPRNTNLSILSSFKIAEEKAREKQSAYEVALAMAKTELDNLAEHLAGKRFHRILFDQKDIEQPIGIELKSLKPTENIDLTREISDAISKFEISDLVGDLDYYVCVLVFSDLLSISEIMSAAKSGLQELRLILSQSGNASKGLRAFVEKKFADLRKAHPSIPILVRECEGVEPVLVARYAFGKERKVPVMDMNDSQIETKIKELSAMK
eukprot:Nk52_evm35s230 gene=Nk52_evmTU35s230